MNFYHDKYVPVPRNLANISSEIPIETQNQREEDPPTNISSPDFVTCFNIPSWDDGFEYIYAMVESGHPLRLRYIAAVQDYQDANQLFQQANAGYEDYFRTSLLLELNIRSQFDFIFEAISNTLDSPT